MVLTSVELDDGLVLRLVGPRDVWRVRILIDGVVHLTGGSDRNEI